MKSPFEVFLTTHLKLVADVERLKESVLMVIDNQRVDPYTGNAFERHLAEAVSELREIATEGAARVRAALDFDVIVENQAPVFMHQITKNRDLVDNLEEVEMLDPRLITA